MRWNIRDHFMSVPSQWQTTLQCNIVSHWLSAYTKWTLKISPTCSTPRGSSPPIWLQQHWMSLLLRVPLPFAANWVTQFSSTGHSHMPASAVGMIPHRWNNNWLYATTRGLQQYKIPLCSSIGYLCYLKFKFYKICYIDTSISILKSFWNFG